MKGDRKMPSADYRPWLPNEAQSRIAGDNAESHAAGRLATPRAQALFGAWAEIAQADFTGITTDGIVTDNLYVLKPEGAPSEQMSIAAWKFLDRLNASEKRRAHHVVGSAQWHNWQNTEIFVEKHGLRLENATKEIRNLAMAVVRASLSDRGYQNALGVMQLNAFLGELLDAPGPLNEWSYNFCLYGNPHVDDPWGWQLWGHHLSVSCLVVNGQMVLTPLFLGAEVCYADRGRFSGVSLFKDHEFKGLQLMNSLPQNMQAHALVGKSISGEDLPERRVHFADYCMMGGAYQDNRIVPYEGICATQFNPSQRNHLLDLVEEYIGAMPDGPRQAKMEEFERHLDYTHFCWIGGSGPDDPFYYRVQSPVTFIEFDHHPGLFLTNDVPLKYHVHTVVRTPNGNDYGIDILRQHHQCANHSHVAR